MTLLEIAIYAAVLGSPGPMICNLDEAGLARCSNGIVGRVISPEAVRYSNGVVVTHRGDAIAFSNGITTALSGDGALQFSNGVGLKRLAEGDYTFSNGVVCRSELPALVRCQRSSERPAS
jgi:hypothetical protein